ncbi:MAG: iron-hydroxamate ABC transporter substrate-binding protein, partial [Vibrio cyclitrophicus]
MNKMPLIALVGMLSFTTSAFSAEQEPFYKAKVGVDSWWGSTKLNEVRKDDAQTPSLHFAFEHQYPMLPNASIRYSSIDADSLAFDKYDYTFYYTVLEHKLMNFDMGVTVTQYSNTKYIEPVNGAQSDFDE